MGEGGISRCVSIVTYTEKGEQTALEEVGPSLRVPAARLSRSPGPGGQHWAQVKPARGTRVGGAAPIQTN